jgi:hypothetical protein
MSVTDKPSGGIVFGQIMLSFTGILALYLALEIEPYKEN